MEPVSVALVDDHEMMLEGLVAMLSLDPRIKVVGTAVTLAGMHQSFSTWNPSVLVADYQLPDGVITSALPRLRLADPDCAVLVLSGVATPDVIEAAASAGAAGIVGKGVDTAELCNAIVTVANGGSVFSARIRQQLAQRAVVREAVPLTDRERDVLRLLAVPFGVEEIASKLKLSPHTVRNHIRSLLTKLNAKSQLEAVLVALRHGLIDLPL